MKNFTMNEIKYSVHTNKLHSESTFIGLVCS